MNKNMIGSLVKETIESLKEQNIEITVENVTSEVKELHNEDIKDLMIELDGISFKYEDVTIIEVY